MPKARIFNLLQYEYSPVDGKSFNFNEQNIISGVGHKSIERWAYIRHDKDEYTELDVERMEKQWNMTVQIGQTKPPHWHIVLQCPSAVDTSVIAKWFNIPENMIDIPKGKGAFLDCVEYLTHSDIRQKLASKHTYDASEVISNFEWQEEVEEMTIRKTRYGKAVSDKEWYRNEVLFKGMTIRQLYDKDPTAYTNDSVTLDRLRKKYLLERAPLPNTRINYYIDGEGGIGKGLLSRAIARSLYPDIKHDDDIFFNVGAKGSAFEGYDGQPVIIWNDRRAYDLIMELDGRGNVFNVFDTHPVKQRQNVKYGSIVLCNTVNIINGIESYMDFLDGLSGEYTGKDGMRHKSEDKSQAYRRLPFIIRVHEDDLDVFINKGFMENTRDFSEYISYGHVRASMKRIAERCGKNEQLAMKLQAQAVKPIIDEHNKLLNAINAQDDDESAILAEFRDAGTFFTHDQLLYDEYAKWMRTLQSRGINIELLPLEEFKEGCGGIPDLREVPKHYENDEPESYEYYEDYENEEMFPKSPQV